MKKKEIVEYILSIKIRSVIYQALIESKEEVDFISLDELAVAVSADTIRFLEITNLIAIKEVSSEQN